MSFQPYWAPGQPAIERTDDTDCDAALQTERCPDRSDPSTHAAEGHAKLHARAVCGEPVSAVLAEIGRTPTDLLVIGKREPSGLDRQHGAMGGVGFRIAYHAPMDVLVLSS